MENEPQAKSKLESLTIQGSLVGVFPAVYTVCKLFGLELPDGSVEAIMNGVAAVMAVSSVVMTFIGRIRATHKLV